MQRAKAARILALLAALAAVSGCGTVRLEVPEGRTVRLLEEHEPASIRVERKIWFWLWGGNPISDNTTKQDILEHDLKEIRIRTEQTLLDSIVTTLGGVFSITVRTLIVEGNR